MSRWAEALAELQQRGEAHVIVTLLATRGSTPRASGSKMIVTAEQSHDSIGGGHLEFKAIQHARTLLAREQDGQSLEQYPLGASLGQCCGGQVWVLYEHFATRGQQLLVFGAGHVARALIPILAQLPLRIRWIDNRENPFPESLPAGIEAEQSDDPVAQLETAAPGSWALVLTHNHQLDYALTEAALGRGDLGYLGVIGSATKARRFRQRLQHRGFSKAQIEQLICPVGLVEVSGKRPMEVAVSIAAQLIARYQAAAPEHNARQQLEWRQLKALLGSAESSPLSPAATGTSRGKPDEA